MAWIVIRVRMPVSRKEQTIAETGEFPCPSCGEDRTYSLLVVYEATGLLARFLPADGKITQVRVNCAECGSGYPGEIRDRALYRDRK
jgi:transcription elongation factor Elf1